MKWLVPPAPHGQYVPHGGCSPYCTQHTLAHPPTRPPDRTHNRQHQKPKPIHTLNKVQPRRAGFEIYTQTPATRNTSHPTHHRSVEMQSHQPLQHTSSTRNQNHESATRERKVNLTHGDGYAATTAQPNQNHRITSTSHLCVGIS
jgi:hypothetical protein